MPFPVTLARCEGSIWAWTMMGTKDCWECCSAELSISRFSSQAHEESEAGLTRWSPESQVIQMARDRIWPLSLLIVFSVKRNITYIFNINYYIIWDIIYIYIYIIFKNNIIVIMVIVTQYNAIIHDHFIPERFQPWAVPMFRSFFFGHRARLTCHGWTALRLVDAMKMHLDRRSGC